VNDLPHSIAFIGGGNMARSLVGGLLTAGFPAGDVLVCEPDAGARTALAERGVASRADNAASRDAEVVVLAVKPQVLLGVLDRLSPAPGQLLISIAAGVPLSAIGRHCRSDQPLVRAMPNTPALLGAGITALYAGAAVSELQRRQAEAVLAAAGQTLWVEAESELDTVTAVSGSGPAYFFYLMEHLMAAARELGMDGETARRLTLETAWGAARMAREGDDDPATLRRRVTSPGGTTERALERLDAAGTPAAIREAVTGAAARARELAEEFGGS